MKQLMCLIFSCGLSLFTQDVLANCDIEDVMEMVDEDLSKSEISSECSNLVNDAPGCSVRKVIRLVGKSYDIDEIADECSGGGQSQGPGNSNSFNGSTAPQVSNICQTSFMWCALGQSAPTGTPCWCNTGRGRASGRIVPR
ncbi:MAG: hypothetical protein Pars93KO_28270 [Parasphingorhabdus sp.]